MVVYLYLRDGKSPQVSRTLLGILANLNNAFVRMISIFPIIIIIIFIIIIHADNLDYKINQLMLIWLVVLVLWHINLCRLFNAKSIFSEKSSI